MNAFTFCEFINVHKDIMKTQEINIKWGTEEEKQTVLKATNDLFLPPTNDISNIPPKRKERKKKYFKAFSKKNRKKKTVATLGMLINLHILIKTGGTKICIGKKKVT